MLRGLGLLRGSLTISHKFNRFPISALCLDVDSGTQPAISPPMPSVKVPLIRPDWLFENTERLFCMQAANLNSLDRSPDNIVLFPHQVGFSRRMTLASSWGKRRTKGSSSVASTLRLRRMAEDPMTPSRMVELFALKRDEKAPENLIRDALEVLHRRNGISGNQLSGEGLRESLDRR